MFIMMAISLMEVVLIGRGTAGGSVVRCASTNTVEDP